MFEKDDWWFASEIYSMLIIGYVVSMALIALFFGSGVETLKLTAFNDQNLLQVMSSHLTIFVAGLPGVFLVAVVMNLGEIKGDTIEIINRIKEKWFKKEEKKIPPFPLA